MKPRVLIEWLLEPMPGVSEAKRLDLLDRACHRACGETPRPAPVDPCSKLTPRQKQVLSYISKGLLVKEIAAAMNLSISTVENYKTTIYRVLNVHNKVEAARIALTFFVD